MTSLRISLLIWQIRFKVIVYCWLNLPSTTWMYGLRFCTKWFFLVKGRRCTWKKLLLWSCTPRLLYGLRTCIKWMYVLYPGTVLLIMVLYQVNVCPVPGDCIDYYGPVSSECMSCTRGLYCLSWSCTRWMYDPRNCTRWLYGLEVCAWMLYGLSSYTYRLYDLETVPAGCMVLGPVPDGWIVWW